MKKLLIILTLGLMFGQTKLESRAYEVPTINFTSGNNMNFNLEEIVGMDLDYALIKIIKVSDYYIDDNYSQIYLRTNNITYDGDANNYNATGVRLENGGTVQYQDVDADDYMTYTGSNNISFRSNNSNGWVDLIIMVTAPFPIEDTGYMEEDFDFCINEGFNLVSYPCENDIAINDALPSEISSNLSSIVGEGLAGVNINGTWVGSLTELQSGRGYWFNSSIEACFNYECAEN